MAQCKNWLQPLSVARNCWKNRILHLSCRHQQQTQRRQQKQASAKGKKKGAIVLEVDQLTKQITRDRERSYIFENLSFDIRSGMKIGLLGRNGAGKSTLMKILAGLDYDFDGKVVRHFDESVVGTGSSGLRSDLRVGYLEQEPQLMGDETIFDNVMRGMQHITGLQQRWEAICLEFAKDPQFADYDTLIEEQSTIQHELDLLNGWNIDENVMDACLNLKCPPVDTYVSQLSGGERRRVALAKLLLSRPDVLMLDEPTNHLDITTVQWLERFINDFRGVVMCVTHDRMFLESICNHIFELDHSRLFTFEGHYSHWVKRRADISFHTDKSQQKMKKTLEREFQMLKSGQKGLKSRINKIQLLEERLHSSDGGADSPIPFIGYEPSLLIPQGPMLKYDSAAVEVNNLSFVRDGRTFFSNLTFTLKPGMVVGVVGANGVGKSTLIRLIIDDLQATRGTIKLGNNVKIGYIDQNRQDLNAANMVWEEITQGHNSIRIHESRTMQGREYVKQFNFAGQSQEKLVGYLSGGERNRVHLAKCLRDGCNVLVLDEPSNDLDIDTLRKLEECMETFRGVAIIVSHDRYFLDRICTHLIAFDAPIHNTSAAGIDIDGDGDPLPPPTVHWFEGNYSEYLHFRKHASKPHLTIDD